MRGIGELKMLKRCSNCEHYGIDMKAVMLCVYAHKCYKKGHGIIRPFWNGWKCKDWRKKQ
jgi:hypothetical protein